MSLVFEGGRVLQCTNPTHKFFCPFTLRRGLTSSNARFFLNAGATLKVAQRQAVFIA